MTPRVIRAILFFVLMTVALVILNRVAFKSVTAVAPGSTERKPALAATVNEGGGTGLPSLAVIPFSASSSGPDDGYFALGFSEEIINSLERRGGIRVIARHSAFRAAEAGTDDAALARRLGVENLLTGSIARAGGRLEVRARLSSPVSGETLWQNDYPAGTEDSGSILGDIIHQATAALGRSTADDPVPAISDSPGPAAFTAYQQGHERLDRAPRDGIPALRESSVYFGQAFARAPSYADAYLGHARLFVAQLMSQADGRLDGNISPADIEAAPGALRLDYDQAVRHAADDRARLITAFDRQLLLGQWARLGELGEAALSAPGCRFTRWGLLLAPLGLADSAQRAGVRRSGCDPLSEEAWAERSVALLWLERPEVALNAARSGPQGAVSFARAQAWALALAAGGDRSAARRLPATQSRSEPERLALQASLAALAGDVVSAAEAQADFLLAGGQDDRISLYLEAQRGNRHEANRLAGLIDRRPFGYLALLRAIRDCYCGAPFDLEAVPDFAARLATSDLAWPPNRPMDFPLKHW